LPELVTLRAGAAEATIAPSVGATCISFKVGGRDVLEPPPSLDALMARPNGYGCPILFPFPGQLEPGRYELLGRGVQVDANGPTGRHGHGFASRRPWRLLDRSDDACGCRLEGGGGDEFPWRFRLTARWRVTAGLLSLGVILENLDDGEMPFGLGLHLYLVAGASELVEVPAREEWEHEGGIPSGARGPSSGAWRVEELTAGASTLVTGLPDGDIEARVGATVLRWPGDRFGEVVLYRPPERRSVCVEPWTSVSNAAAQIAPGAPHGLVGLAPHASWSAWLEIAAN
jgi:aldose 1-epimerase